MDQVFSSGALLHLQCSEWTADLLLCFCDCGAKLLASLPLLRRLQRVVEALGSTFTLISGDSSFVFQTSSVRIACIGLSLVQQLLAPNLDGTHSAEHCSADGSLLLGCNSVHHRTICFHCNTPRGIHLR